MLPLVLVGIAGLTGVAWHKARKTRQSSTYGILTPERKYGLMRALDGKLTPDKYRTLADEFEKQGLPDEADLLRKRASLSEMTPDKKQALNDLVKKALDSKNPDAIRQASDYLLSIGAVGNAKNLANHARAVATKNAIAPTAPAILPPPVEDLTAHEIPGASPEVEAPPVAPAPSGEAAAEGDAGDVTEVHKAIPDLTDRS